MQGSCARCTVCVCVCGSGSHLVLHLDDAVHVSLRQSLGSTDLLHGMPVVEQNLVHARRSVAVHLCDLGTTVILFMVQTADCHLLSSKQVRLANPFFHSALGHCGEKNERRCVLEPKWLWKKTESCVLNALPFGKKVIILCVNIVC